MRNRRSLAGFILILFSFSSLQAAAQEDTTAAKKPKNRKNIIRYNITNPLIFGGKTMIWGYERTIGPHQSLSLNVGLFSLPKLDLFDINTSDSIQLESGTKEKGYNVSLDYRFYLAKENKHNAPRGVYLAPYVSYTFFERVNSWSIESNSGSRVDLETTFNLKIATVGGELGYQFILWDRVAIDLILIGPGMSSYLFEAKLNTSLDADDEEELFKKINEYLADKLPGYSLVIDDAEFEKSGSTKTTSFGFRYMVHIGIRF